MFLRQSMKTLRTCRRYLHTTNHYPDIGTSIAELNKLHPWDLTPDQLLSKYGGNIFLEEEEMESVFGDAPPVSNSSMNNLSIVQEPQFVPPSTESNEQHLTHISNTGEAQMVDVSSKESTKRVATAGCRVILGRKVFELVSANQIAKGDVLSVAKIAGINGAKQTSNLIPLCHNINLTHIRVDLTLNEKDFSVEIEGEAASTGKTGVEMEALTAVTIAGLTVYDMCKAASKDIKITDTRLEHKSGGKSGEWWRNQ